MPPTTPVKVPLKVKVPPKVPFKVYYCEDLEQDRLFEGRTSIALKIKQHLQQQGYSFTDNPAEADLIHLHSSGVLDSYHAYRLKRKYGLPCIYTLYSVAETEPWGHLRNYLAQKRLARKFKGSFLASSSAMLPLQWRSFFLNRLDRVVVASEYSRQKLGKNSRLIRMGVDTNKFRPAGQSRSAGKIQPTELSPVQPAIIKDSKTINPQIVKVAYFGHPSGSKGVLEFLHASRHFPKNTEVHFYPSRTPPELLGLVRKINSRIIIHGKSHEIQEEYRKIDIVVLPYRNQLAAISNPLVLLEAMASGLAVITTSLPFVREIVQDAAVQVKPYSSREIVRAVAELAANPLRRENLGITARQRIKDCYEESRMLAEYESLYREVHREVSGEAQKQVPGEVTK